MKRYLIPILLICLMTGQIAVANAANYIPHMQVSAENIYLAAGAKSNVTIVLTNIGTYDLTEIDDILTSTTPGLSVIANAHYVSNIIAVDEVARYNVTLYVDQSLSVGSYTLTYTASYVRFGNRVTINVPITVVVANAFNPMVKATVSPSSLVGGATTTIKVKVENIASINLADVEVLMASGSSLLSIENQLNYYAPVIQKDSSASFNVEIRALESAPVGAYSIAATIYYSDEIGNRYKQSVTLPLDVDTVYVPTLPIVTVTNMGVADVTPGEQFDITLRIACTGAAISNGKATLSLDPTGLLSPVTPLNVALGDLKPGEYVDEKFTLILSGSAPAEQLPLTVTVKYADPRGAQSMATEVITVPIKDLVEFSLMKDVVVSADRGATTTFEGDLLLIGTGKVDFASISIVADGPVRRVAGSTEYMGAIDPDSPVPFTIQFGTGSNATLGDYTMHLKITYLNSRNVMENRTISVQLQVVNPTPTTPATANDGGFWGWLRRLFGLQ